MPTVTLRVYPALRFLLAPRRRAAPFAVQAAATDTVGHVVESVGVPLTEVGPLALDGRRVEATTRVHDGVLEVAPRPRPQSAPTDPPRFLLDAHLGSLARKMRLLGLDAAWSADADDGDLAARAAAEQRVLLSQDRALLHRRVIPVGALVRGTGARAQLEDVLDRFAPTLAPWTRCVACGGSLRAVDATEVAGQIEAGTRRTYDTFSRCTACGRVYWRGAHARRLEADVAWAEEVVAARTAAARPS